ncbi:DEAD box ATP dependent RNA helicase [Echinococcus multilocularis]|uniref:Leucine-rich repeat and WD repeat-containing protein 1 n=1 Tax=Echinococcus multilocularis TaxID=6211 RepID=A0A068YCR0_ECHMU|nr:DEAD box ATP dependent RNA helicase [Echinococcus multilocularis]
MADDLASQGFEIVTDENGNELVKLLFMDENDESSGYALVSPEDAKRIMNGEATLQNVIDEDGKQVLTLVPVEQDQLGLQEAAGSGEGVNSEPAPPPSEDNVKSSEDVLEPPFETETSTYKKTDEEATEAISKEDSVVSDIAPTNEDVEVTSAGPASASAGAENAEQFTITEQSALLDNQPIQMVSLLDSAGNVIDQKHGQTGAQVVMELHGQAFAYEIRGPTETGEPLTSTLVLSVESAEEQTVSQLVNAPESSENSQVQWLASESKQAESDIPAGQQYTLTEATATVDGKSVQTVVLEDDKGNIMDQKQGNIGQHVIIELNGQSLDYVFLGPSENGEPVQTVLVVTQDDGSGDESEAGLTAANWCPVGLSHDLYTTIRRHSEAIVHERLSNRPELSFPNAASEPYQRKLGSYAAYQEMVELAKTYAVGASQGETLERYETLRGHAKIYRCGPQARPLTVNEMVINEVASQLCRFKPGLLFHKRELYQLALGVAEACSQEIKAAQATYQPHQTQQQAQLLHPPQPESTVVSGQVASSQLAMLESRGLNAIQPNHVPVSTNVVMSHAGAAVSAGNVVPISPEGGVVLAYTTKGASGDANTLVGQTLKGKQSLGVGTLQHYIPNMTVVKRDLTYKLSASEMEALRLAAINALTDLPTTLEVKPKSDCTNIERASWDRATELAALRSESAIDTTDPHAVASLLVNDTTRVDSVRESAALYGRTPLQSTSSGPSANVISPPYPVASQLATAARSSPLLTPYETACNEAAAYLAAGQPALLTRRRELAELARKVVRNCGCQFTHAPSLDRGYFSVDQVMELDLSAAEQLLHDPLERLDLNDSLELDSLDDKLMSLDLSCEEHNILDDIAIYTVTGTDTLKKVRILSLPDCSFTGIMPIHLNQCVNLVELNLSNNCLHGLPRCLHLPKLKRLNLSKNPLLVRFARENGPPLIEQFPRLISVELDPELKEMLKPQSLAYLCPLLNSINGEEFNAEANEDTIKTAQAAKQELAALVHSKWEDDLVEFFKKSVPHRDLICVIETLVLHAVNQSLTVDEPFKHCKAVLARQIAEEFLAPKVVDDEDEEEHAGDVQVRSDSESHENAGNDAVTATMEEPSSTTGASEEVPTKAESESADQVVTAVTSAAAASNTTTTNADGAKKEDRKAAEAEREAVAAAHNMTLLPDEPLDRLSGIIGTAMQHGKTVVYSVIRSAARQPNGDLIIPVVGGSIANGLDSTRQPDDSLEQSDSENNAPQSMVTTGQPAYRRTTMGGTRTIPSSGAVLGSRRPGLMLAGRGGGVNKRASTVARRHEEEYSMADMSAAHDYSAYGDLDEQEDVVPPKPVKTPGHWQPGKRGRPPASHSQKRALAQQEEKETAALLQNVKIPPPHAPPPATLRMSTRDSNRMKRFSAYGAIDTAAALAGQEEALMVAAIAQEDEEAEGPFSEEREDEATRRGSGGLRKSEGEVHAEIATVDESEGVLRSEETEDAASPGPAPPKRGRRPGSTLKALRARSFGANTPTASNSIDADNVHAFSPKDFEDETLIRHLIDTSINADSVPPVPSLVQLGEVVDYDPLHFIRCHARDNDPLDCSTKVWRCAFEPNPTDSRSTTSVVATCGGECVCLIDCQTGKVLKRFKHVGEEFYAVAWTTVEMASGHPTNLLAAAGKLKEIRLLHPEQLVCYAEMKGHREEIACMVFHPTKPTILFSGDSKACVCVWDVGVPSAPEYRTKHHLLMRLICPRPHLNPVLNLVFMPNYDTLLAGCEDGVFAWIIQDFRKQRFAEDRVPTMEIKIPTNREPCFDGLARLSENLVVVKCVEEGEIYVFDFAQLLLSRKRAASLKKIVTAEVLGQLRWQTTDEIYINVTARPGLGAVVCGDNEGTIWVYDLQEHVVNEENSTKFKVKPVKILEWPECSVGGNREEDPQVKESINSGFKNPVVNATDISSDGAFLVAVTDNNLVCIWNFSG